MKQVYVFGVIWLLIVCNTLHAQTAFQLIKTIKIQADFFTTDNQSSIYAVKGIELTKFDKTGKLLYRYSDNNFGNITSVDASNMLKIVVFYGTYLQAVFLDNTLSLNGEPISFEKLGFVQTQLVCSSHNSGLWIYDQQNMQLLRFDQNLGITQQTGNLSALLQIEMLPDLLMEYDNKVYLNNPTTGILVFDSYGTYYKTIPAKNVKRFQPIGDWVYYNVDTTIKAYNIKAADEITYEAPLSSFKNFRLEMNTLFLQTKDEIQVYIPAE